MNLLVLPVMVFITYFVKIKISIGVQKVNASVNFAVISATNTTSKSVKPKH